MKVLVTGAGGYIGSVLVPMLLDAGHSVVALDRFFFGKGRLPAGRKGLDIVEADIRTVGESIFAGVHSVIDLAALSNDPLGELNPEKTWAINHLGRVRIARLAKSRGAKRYVFPSSCSIYGFNDGVVDEKSGVNPLTTYAKANQRAEADLLGLSGSGFCVTVMRQATVYGLSPRMRFDLAVNSMVHGFFRNGKIPISGDGRQWRPFIHVEDTARALRMALEADEGAVNGEIFNVGSNAQNYPIFGLGERVAKAIGVPFHYELYGSADFRSYRVNFDKVRKTLGFSPKHDVGDGAAEIWKALREGKLDADDPQAITLDWYKRLIARGAEI